MAASKKSVGKAKAVKAKAPAKKVVAKKPAKAKAPAKKVVAKKPAKAKAPAKKVVAKKPVAAKAPAKKVVAKKPAQAKAAKVVFPVTAKLTVAEAKKALKATGGLRAKAGKMLGFAPSTFKDFLKRNNL